METLQEEDGGSASEQSDDCKQRARDSPAVRSSNSDNDELSEGPFTLLKMYTAQA
jgi:hypothetical protein